MGDPVRERRELLALLLDASKLRPRELPMSVMAIPLTMLPHLMQLTADQV